MDDAQPASQSSASDRGRIGCGFHGTNRETEEPGEAVQEQVILRKREGHPRAQDLEARQEGRAEA